MMVTQRKWCLLAVGLSLTALLGAAITEIDPDAGDKTAELPAFPANAVAGVPNCDVIGSFGSPPFPMGSNRYRGNVYRFEFDAAINEIKMELAFTGTTDLYVAIHRKAADGDYERYPIGTPDIIIPDAIGTGLPAVYTTADAVPPMTDPVPIEAGYDYAIAFAWGSHSVTYGRDNQLYPLPFRAGQVLGLVAATTLPPDPEHPDPDPLVPETFPELPLFTSGAYSMQLCFEPQPGACCSNGGCTESLETACTGAGSFFHGEYTYCLDTPCIFGACCTRCGQCLDGYTEDACFLDADADGASHWSDAACPADPAELCTPVVGACCRGTGCTMECQEHCENPPKGEGLSPGVFLGDGTNCTPNMCQGACCVSGACLNRTRVDCPPPQVFKGEGTTCLTLPPANECGGACCRGFDINDLDFCERVSRRSFCASDPQGYPSAAYRGDNTTCPTDCNNPNGCCPDNCTCPTYNACCLPDGTCINTTLNQCRAGWMQGEFAAGQLCEDAAPGAFCAASLQRCCFTNGTCKLLTDTGCTALGGTPSAETTCPTGVCTGFVPTGACCSTTAADCLVRTEAECNAQGRQYRGNGTDCATPDVCPGFGACCRFDGDCFEALTSAECAARGGDYEGDASVCDPPGSPPPICEDERGACCAITGTCLFITQAQCLGLETPGEFKGIGVPCLADTCPAGACCFAAEACAMRMKAYCTPDTDRAYQGDGVECAPNPCILGACCIGVTCTKETRITCDRILGVYHGEGTDCDPLPCACTENTQCDDGNACTINDMCVDGKCSYSDLVCDDDNPCTDDTCLPATGCEFTNNDTNTCDDGNPCTSDDACTGGACNGTVLADGESCADADLCNGTEVCLAGTCQPGTPLTCDDGNQCTDDGCDPATGCVFTEDNTNTCADADACNGTETCQAGTCQPGTPLVCDDGNACTDDSCDPATGCANDADDTNTCDDGNTCTSDDACAGGACSGTVRGDGELCDDGNPCTSDDACTGGACNGTVLGDGELCDDGDICNGIDTCQAGTCQQGTPPGCVDSDGCCPPGCNNSNDNDCPSLQGPAVLKWESRLTHPLVVNAPVELEIPDTGLFSEPRGGIKMIVVTFDGAVNPVTAIPADVLICGNNVNNTPLDLSGNVISTATSAGSTKLEISFTPPLPNFARYKITISTNIQGMSGDPIQAGTGGLSRILTALQGDAAGGGDRRVNATDLGLVRSLVGVNPIDPLILNHVRADANNDGRINATDLGLVRGRVGQDARNILDPVCP